jgi:hypothetical protein
MVMTRPIRPADARALLNAAVRKLDAITLESFTPTWTRPSGR